MDTTKQRIAIAEAFLKTLKKINLTDDPYISVMLKEAYNRGLDTAISLVGEIIGGSDEAGTLICGLECSKYKPSHPEQ